MSSKVEDSIVDESEIRCSVCDRLLEYSVASLTRFKDNSLKQFMLHDLLMALLRHSSSLHRQLVGVHDSLTARLAYYFRDDNSHLDLASYIAAHEASVASAGPSVAPPSAPITSQSSVSTSTTDLFPEVVTSSVSTSTTDLASIPDPSTASSLVDQACQTDVSGDVNLSAMLYELERHNLRAVTHNRMLRLTVTRLQEHTAALENALKVKYFSEIRGNDFFGQDQGDSLGVLQDAFEEVDAALCHYVHPPGSKYQRPPREYRDSHLWPVMPLTRQRPSSKESGTSRRLPPSAYAHELGRNQILRDDTDPTSQSAAIVRRCIDPSALPGVVVDLTNASPETNYAIRLLECSSSGKLDAYPIDLSFPELTSLSAPFELPLVKSSHPACMLRRSAMTRVSVDFSRLPVNSTSSTPPKVSTSPTLDAPAITEASGVAPPSSVAVSSPTSTVVLESSSEHSDGHSLFGGSSEIGRAHV